MQPNATAIVIVVGTGLHLSDDMGLSFDRKIVIKT